MWSIYSLESFKRGFTTIERSVFIILFGSFESGKTAATMAAKFNGVSEDFRLIDILNMFLEVPPLMKDLTTWKPLVKKENLLDSTPEQEKVETSLASLKNLTSNLAAAEFISKVLMKMQI